MPISKSKFQEFKQETRNDSVLQEVITLIKDSWPDSFPSIRLQSNHFMMSKKNFHLHADGVLLKVDRVAVPSSMRVDMLKRIHEGHIGIEKFKTRAWEVMYWPRMNAEIEDYISKCKCLFTTSQSSTERVSLTSHDVPMGPWERLDLICFIV